MKIDWTLDAWNIIIAAAFLAGIWGKLSSISTKVDAMWEHFLREE